MQQLEKTELIQTKLHRPPLPTDLVDRPRLTRLIETDILHPLLLISAPAGYGKSTLAKSLVEALNYPSAWIQLDEHDNDLVLFLIYFLSAIQKIYPEALDETSALLKVSPPPPLQAMVTSLVNELDQIGENYLLVLDDYHCIHDASIHQLLDQLLLHPPSSFHMILSSRLDPPLSLARQRAHAKIVEFRAEDLRFTLEETRQLMEKMINAEVDGATIINLTEETEGWVTGIRLAALAMRHRAGRGRIQGLSVNNRYVAEYLIEEILSDQIEVYSSCMLKLSVLGRFNAELCQAVCFEEENVIEHGSVNGKDILDWLQASNLFVISLDDQGDWFRFHHLFREFLQDELRRRISMEGINDIRARASRWFETNNLFEEALQQGIQAGDINRAVHLVSRQRYDLLNNAQWQQVARYMALFPPEIVRGSPDLLITKAWLSYHNGSWSEIPAAITEIEHLIEKTSIPSERLGYLHGEVNALRSLMSVLAADLENAIRQAERSIAETAPELYIVRTLARSCLSGALQMAGDLSGAYHAVYDSFETEPVKTDQSRATMIIPACNIHWMAADLNGLSKAARLCVEWSQKANSREILGFGLMQLGTASYHLNNLSAAEECFSEVVMKPYQNYGENLAYSYIGLALTHLALRRPESAQSVADQLLNFFLESGNTTLLPLAQAFQAELSLRLGQFSKASLWADQFATPPPLGPLYRIYTPHLTQVKAWLAQKTPASHQKAAEYLADLHTFLVSLHNTQFTIEALALKTLLSLAHEDRNSALNLLEQALKIAEPTGNIRVFIDHGEPILSLLQELYERGVYRVYIVRLLEAAQPAASDHSRINQSTLIEPLTNRELDVLALLAERRTNKEIASKLGIAVGTVRQHSHNLYQKLDVSNRRQAVRKAIELGVLKE